MDYFYEIYINGRGKLQYSTSVPQKSELEILEWAENYCLITREEFPLVKYAKEISREEEDDIGAVQL